MAGNSIEINSNVNDINIQPDFNKITVVNPDGCFVTITQPVTNVIQVATPGPAGSAGPTGPIGPSGSFETGSFATTGSNNFIGNQIITGSLEVTEVITGSIVSASYAISSSLAEEASNNFDIIAYNNTTFNITAIRTNGGQQTATITNVPSSSYTSTASYVNPLQQNVIITGSVDVKNGNVNIKSNSNFFQGTSTSGDNISLIGVNNQDEIYIGNQGYTNIIADDTNIEGDTQITGSLIVSGSSTFTNIGPAIFSGSVIVTGGITGSIASASYASFADLATNASTASYVNPLHQDVFITGSLNTTGSVNFEGDAVITGSFTVSTSITASSITATSASFTHISGTISNIIWTVDFTDGELNTTLYAPYNLAINSVTNIYNSPTTAISSSGSPYTLGNAITTGEPIDITVSTGSVINLNITR
jgi:hypothetical protein